MSLAIPDSWLYIVSFTPTGYRSCLARLKLFTDSATGEFGKCNLVEREGGVRRSAKRWRWTAEHMPSPTPILDLEAPLPTRAKHWQMQLRWWHTLLIVGGFFVVAPGIAVLFMLYPNRFILALLETMGQWLPFGKVVDSINPHLLPVLFLTWMAACLLQTVVHEAVHTLAGVAVGFTPEMLIMGPLRIAFQGAKPCLHMARPGAFDGVCHVKVPTIIGVHRKYLFHVGMAPLANLVIGGGIIAIWRLGAFGGLSISVKTLLLGFGYLSILLGLMSLVPARLKSGQYTDGARLWMVATNSTKWRRWLSLVALEIQRAKGTPLKRLNRKWLGNACSVDDGSSENLAGHWITYLSGEADDDAAVAAVHLEACLRNAEIATDEFVDLLRAMASTFHAWHTRDAVKAEKWFNAIRELASLPRILQIRTMVALRLAQNQKDEALAKWNEGLAVIKSYPPAQSEPMEKSWTEWKAEILKRCARAEETTQSDPSSSAQ